jgi:hypothetical protein
VKTFSLAEVAAQVLPAEWRDAERWLARRLNRGEIRGYRVGRVWRLTQAQVDELIERYSNDAAEPAPTAARATSVVGGLSARSRRRLRSAS